MAGTLVILGASSRAAAFSAMRAGLTPYCADCFADADLAAQCTALRAQRWPQDLPRLAEQLPPSPWIYTGGLENYPELLDQIAGQRPLYGNRGDVLANARDPFAIARVLSEAGFACPRCERSGERLDGDVRWLRKSHRSSGGLGVDFWPELAGAPHPQPLSHKGRGEEEGPRDWYHDDHYFQQYIPGTACSASYIAADGRAVLVGVAEQMLWGPHESARFRYAGSLGPVPLAAELDSELRRLGNTLASSLKLVGLFGVDGVLAGDRFWPVEINPRYTASMEVHERASNRSLVAEHLAACERGALPGAPDRAGSRWFAKEVLYAERDLRVGPALHQWVFQQNTGMWPAVADIPAPGSVVESGHPILTIFAEGDTRAAAVEMLEERRRRAWAALANS